ncbi:hypothetical protein, partial [Methanoregula sp.]|uniref:hypothetical protein n=1 Tax=Methanoregula sp. TaxID=2052170 RepID=UPI000CB4D324
TQDVAIVDAHADAATAQEEVDSLETVVDAGVKIAAANLAGGAANAFAFAWENPESVPIIVQRVTLDRTAAGGTATAVADVGTAVDATTHSDNLIDGVDLNATGPVDNITDKGSNGKSRQRLDANGGTTAWITGQILTEAAAALTGKVYIEYIKVRA